MTSTPNPYAPPTTECQPPPSQHRSVSTVLKMLITIGGICFVGFTVVLLRSTPLDRKAGWLFACSVPFVVAWVYFALRSHRWIYYTSFAFAGVQMLVAAIMVAREIGNPVFFVVSVNAGIAASALTLGYLDHRQLRMQRSEA